MAGQQTGRLENFLKKQNPEKQSCWRKEKPEGLEVMREEPFTTAKDSLGFQVWVMIYQDGVLNRRVTMEKIEG